MAKYIGPKRKINIKFQEEILPFLNKNKIFNNKIINIPSFKLKPGDEISINNKSKIYKNMSKLLSTKSNKYYWLDFDNINLIAKYLKDPNINDLPEDIKNDFIFGKC